MALPLERIDELLTRGSFSQPAVFRSFFILSRGQRVLIMRPDIHLLHSEAYAFLI